MLHTAYMLNLMCHLLISKMMRNIYDDKICESDVIGYLTCSMECYEIQHKPI